MILQNPTNIQLLDIGIIICHIIAFSSLIISGIVFYIKSKEMPQLSRQYILGIFLFFVLYGVSRFIMFIYELSMEPFIWRLFPNEANQLLASSPSLNGRYLAAWYSSTIISAVALTSFLIQLEGIILNKKTKYILTLIFTISISFAIIFGASSASDISFGKIMLYISSFPALMVPFIYFYMGFKTTGETRKRGFGSGLGFLLIYLGIACNSAAAKVILVYLFSGIIGVYFSYVFYGIFILIGIIIFIKNAKFNQ